MKRGAIALGLACCVSLMLTGCGSIPVMTGEQTEMVSEYAASLLLKYDSANHSRLVDTSSFMDSYNNAKKLHDDAEKAYYDEKKREEDERRREAEEQEAANQKYNEEKESSGTGKNGKKNDGTGGATVINTMSITEFLGLDNFSIVYAGNDVMNQYPEDAKVSDSCVADPGKDLLIVYFNVTNKSDSKCELNMFELDPIFKLSVNDGLYTAALHSFVLDDDMSIYIGDFGPGEMKRLILLLDVADNTSVSTLSMRISLGNDSITKTLK